MAAREARGQTCGHADTGRPVVLGFAHGFGNALLTLTLTTLATLLIFFAGLGQVIMGVVKLAWGSAPTETPGVMYWSWPVIQVVSVLVLWAWSRVFMHLIEVASVRGLIQIPLVANPFETSSPVLTRYWPPPVWPNPVLAGGLHHAVHTVGVRLLGSVYLLTTSLSRVCQASRERR